MLFPRLLRHPILRAEMKKPFHDALSRRERQIVEAVYALGEASVREVVEHLGEPDAYDSLRVLLHKLHEKGVLRRRRDGRRYLYTPVVSRERARRPALRHLLATLFPESPSGAVLALLDLSRDELSQQDLDRISEWIEEQSRHGKGGA